MRLDLPPHTAARVPPPAVSPAGDVHPAVWDAAQHAGYVCLDLTLREGRIVRHVVDLVAEEGNVYALRPTIEDRYRALAAATARRFQRLARLSDDPSREASAVLSLLDRGVGVIPLSHRDGVVLMLGAEAMAILIPLIELASALFDAIGARLFEGPTEEVRTSIETVVDKISHASNT